MATSVLNNERVSTANDEGCNGTWGFNCWGATLYVLEMSEELDWVEREEMTEFIDEATKEADGRRKAGDILALYSTDSWYGEEELIHTAVYIGGGEYFHKRGSNFSEITNIQGVFGAYPQTERSEFRRVIK